MTLELLPNELLIEVIEFLDAVEAFRAFSNLNSRFNTLLFTHCQCSRLDFNSVLKSGFDIVCKKYLPLIINQIRSLRLSDNIDESPSQTNVFFSFHMLLNHFRHLRSLVLCYIGNEPTLRKLIVDCRQLPHLTHLKMIQCHSRYMSSDDFCNNVWSLSNLTHCHLYMRGSLRIPNLISTSLQTLAVSCECWGLSQANDILRCTPSLQRFHVPLNDLNDTYHHTLPSFLSITALKLSNVRSSNVMRRILQAMPNLTHLTADLYDIDCDGYQWEELIESYLPQLSIFRLRMHVQLRSKTNSERGVDQFVDSFRTYFWLGKHQWYVHCHHRWDYEYMNILLYTVPYGFAKLNLERFAMTYITTSSEDNQRPCFDRVSHFSCNLIHQNDTSYIRMPNVRHLVIRLQFNKIFWKIFPTFDQLRSLSVSSASEDIQPLQAILDGAPHLHSLTVRPWLPFSMVAIKIRSTSLRRLDLQIDDLVNTTYFSDETCKALIESPLIRQCEELLINVENHESILVLINGLPNLRMLRVSCLSHAKDVFVYNQFKVETQSVVQWLQKQLPPTHVTSIGEPRRPIWIHLI